MLASPAEECRIQVLLTGALSAGCNSFRLSIEWSRLFPQRGKLCQEAVTRYNEIFDCLEK